MSLKIRYYLTDNTKLDDMVCEGDTEGVDTSELLEDFLWAMCRKALPLNDRKKKTTRNEPLCYYWNGYWYSGNIVGVLRKQAFAYEGKTYDITVEIRSRFDRKDKPWFLATMLRSMHSLKPNRMSAPHREESFFDFLLAFVLCQQLMEALQKGWYRTYVRRESNDSRMIGALNVPEHIRRNGGLDNGRIACRYRERTEKNSLNSLILCAWEYLRSRFPEIIYDMENSDSELLRAIRELNNLFSGQKPRPRDCIAENLRPISHPYYVEYEALRCTCLMVLRDESINFLSGNAEEVQSVLYYLPSLWEDYLEKQMREILPAGYKIKSQKEYPYMYPLPSGTEQKGFPKKAIPDYVISHGNENILVVDAKFKREVKSDTDYDKLIRDMLITGTQTGAFLYPSSEKQDVLEYDVCGNGMTIWTVPVEIPKAEPESDLSDWTEKLSETVADSLRKMPII